MKDIWTYIGEVDLSTVATPAGDGRSLDFHFSKDDYILRVTLFKDYHYQDEMQFDLSRMKERFGDDQ